jgi:putative ABC transport system permease protein
LRTFLLIFGIALGVAGVISIDIARTSVSKSFDLSASALTSRSTHQIMGTDFRVPQSLFTRLRTDLGIFASAPVITAEVRVKEMNDQVLTLMGVDPFSETIFRSIGFKGENNGGTNGFSRVLIQGDGVIISQSLARTHSLGKDSVLTLGFGGRQIKVRVGWVMEGDGRSSGFDGVVLADIAYAQEILGMGDWISRIDLRLDDQEAESIKTILEPGLVLVETDQRNRTVRSLSLSFETSLTAFSILVLFMGIFLIYNTVSFSVARRRQVNGIFRALGATRQDIFWAVEVEILIYALAGSILGVAMGILMGKGVVQVVCATVSDMYYTLTVTQTHIALPTLAKGVVTGLGAALISSVIPALNAANTRPITLMQLSAAQNGLNRYRMGLALGGILIMGLALVIFHLPRPGLGMVFAGVFLVFIGGSFLTPILISGLARIFTRLTFVLTTRAGLGLHWVMARMALGNMTRSLSRNSVLIASLMVVISVYIGIDTMTHSFRLSVIDWVDRNIGGDIHISSMDGLNRSLDAALVNQVKALEGVKDVSAYNIHRAFSSVSGEVHIFSYVRDLSEKKWAWTSPEAGTGDDAALNRLLDREWVFVSEIFAKKHGIQPVRGADFVMETVEGPIKFQVAGIFRDFFMGGGRIIVSPGTMEKYWGHKDITAMQVFVTGRTSGREDRMIREIRNLVPDPGAIRIRSGAAIKQSILEVFGNTFLITSALLVLTALVALTGILNSVMALVLERSRELGILRACGAEPSHVRALVLWECGFSGFMAGLLALPLGWLLSWVLVGVVNFTAFGWTYEMQVSWLTLAQALGFSCLASLGGGGAPAFRAARVPVARALRTE